MLGQLVGLDNNGRLSGKCMHTVRAAKFIARKQWLVCGADDCFLRIYNYNTMDKVKAFEAHTDYIRCATLAACLFTSCSAAEVAQPSSRTLPFRLPFLCNWSTASPERLPRSCTESVMIVLK